MNALNFRSYQPGDENAILELFQQSFNKAMSLDFWNWRFRDNPAASPMIDLAWDGDILAAHYAVSPVILSVNGHDCPTALSMTTMTHPSYRGQGLFTALANSLYARMAQQGYNLVWGFPNDQSHRGFIRDLAWRDIYEIPMFHLDLNHLRSTPQVSQAIVELDAFDARFDDLWQLVHTQHTVMVKRDRRYLHWRFSANPLNQYRLLGHIEGGQLGGYVVFKHYQDDVDIVDIVTTGQESIGTELVVAVLDFCRQNSIKGINAWIPIRCPLHLDMEKMGFHNSQPITYLGAGILNAVEGVDFAHAQQWYYTMGDSDVF